MKIILILVALANPVLCFAQTEKGTFLLGGSFNYSNTKTGGGSTQLTGTYTHTALDFSPNVGYFFFNRFAASITGSIGKEKYSNNAFPSTSTRQYTDVGISARYYFMLSEKWALFPRLDALYGSYSQNSVSINSSGNESIWRGGAGITYFITRSIGVEGLVFYQTMKTTVNATSFSSASTSSEDGFFYRIGFQIYLLPQSRQQ